MAITCRQTGDVIDHSWLTTWDSVVTYYYNLRITAYLRPWGWGFQIDFVAEASAMPEGDIGIPNLYRLALGINLDRCSYEELQPTVPDVVWAQDKPSGWPISWFQVPSLLHNQALLLARHHCLATWIIEFIVLYFIFRGYNLPAQALNRVKYIIMNTLSHVTIRNFTQ